MKKLIALAAACLIAATAFAGSTNSNVFQMRLVLDAPSADSEQMTLVSKSNDTTTRKEKMSVQKTVLVDQSALKSAKVATDSLGHPMIDITLTDAGQTKFAEITRQMIGKRLAIIIGGQVYCAPVIRSEISGGKAQISGSFSKEEAKELVKKLNEAVKK
jgi:preprotein translocase subunit SecD